MQQVELGATGSNPRGVVAVGNGGQARSGRVHIATDLEFVQQVMDRLLIARLGEHEQLSELLAPRVLIEDARRSSPVRAHEEMGLGRADEVFDEEIDQRDDRGPAGRGDLVQDRVRGDAANDDRFHSAVVERYHGLAHRAFERGAPTVEQRVRAVRDRRVRPQDDPGLQLIRKVTRVVDGLEERAGGPRTEAADEAYQGSRRFGHDMRPDVRASATSALESTVPAAVGSGAAGASASALEDGTRLFEERVGRRRLEHIAAVFENAAVSVRLRFDEQREIELGGTGVDAQQIGFDATDVGKLRRDVHHEHHVARDLRTVSLGETVEPRPRMALRVDRRSLHFDDQLGERPVALEPDAHRRAAHEQADDVANFWFRPLTHRDRNCQVGSARHIAERHQPPCKKDHERRGSCRPAQDVEVVLRDDPTVDQPRRPASQHA